MDMVEGRKLFFVMAQKLFELFFVSVEARRSGSWDENALNHNLVTQNFCVRNYNMKRIERKTRTFDHIISDFRRQVAERQKTEFEP